MATRDAQSDSFLNSDAISDDFFIEIVESKLNISRDKFKLRLVLLSPAAGKNENFMSVVYRAQIKIEVLETKSRETVDVIIKALLTTIKELKEFSVFPRERQIYEDVLSSFEKIWSDVGEEIRFGPRSIKFETNPYEIIVLDDLKSGNYQMLNRKVGLNIVQSKLLLTKLAKFHAASTIRYQRDGVINIQFDRKASMPPMPEDSPFITGFAKMFNAFKMSIRGYGGFDEYADKIEKWDTKNLMTMFIDIAVPMDNGFQVLNHGDLWINNMMFKSDDEGTPLDVSMIDFQGPFWGTPTVDLMYFIISSVADDLKIKHFDDLIAHYHEQLTLALKKLNFDQQIPTLSELHIDMRDKGGFAGSCLMFILFVVKNSSSEEINLEMMMTGGDITDMLDRVYNDPNYTKAVKLWLPFLNERGLLDALIEKPKAEE